MPQSVGEALQAARERLAAASQSPRRDAERLLARATGADPTTLLAYPERLLQEEQAALLEGFLLRREASEPMQYILGEQEFFGLPLTVTPDVLIPRPETEHLVEAALAEMPAAEPVRVLDVGTGSGAIAIALAAHRPLFQVTAVDLSAAALLVARSNAERHAVPLRLLQSDLLAGVAGEHYDLIVANLPYVAAGEVLEKQVAAYEPHSALFAGADGLDLYARLIPQAEDALAPGGWLMMEIGAGQQAGVEKLLRSRPAAWQAIRFADDLQGIPRVAMAQTPGSWAAAL